MMLFRTYLLLGCALVAASQTVPKVYQATCCPPKVYQATLQGVALAAPKFTPFLNRLHANVRTPTTLEVKSYIYYDANVKKVAVSSTVTIDEKNTVESDTLLDFSAHDAWVVSHETGKSSCYHAKLNTSMTHACLPTNATLEAVTNIGFGANTVKVNMWRITGSAGWAHVFTEAKSCAMLGHVNHMDQPDTRTLMTTQLSDVLLQIKDRRVFDKSQHCLVAKEVNLADLGIDVAQLSGHFLPDLD